MTALSIQPPFPVFSDADGSPLENGYIWIGQANLDPQTNPIAVYWDEALTILAAQPIRTLGGYPSWNGTPARLYAATSYSIRVLDAKGSLVYSAPDENGPLFGGTISSVDVTFLQAGTGAQERTVQSKLRDVVSVKDFGAVGNGVADDTLAIQSAIDSGFKTIYFPPGIYNCSSQISLYKTRGINLIGSGYETLYDTTRAAKGTYLRYTGTSGTLLALDSCSGFNICDMWLGYNSPSYTGDLVTTDNTGELDTSTGGFLRCFFAGESASANNAASLLRLKKTIIVDVDQCTFVNAKIGIKIVAYVNIATFSRNSFNNLVTNNVYMTTGQNQSLNFYSNTFEPLTNGKASAWDQAAGQALRGFTYRGNWHGDVSIAGALQWVRLENAQGVVIDGNYFGHSGLGASDYAVSFTNCFGIEVTANVFEDKSLNFTNACGGLLVSGNSSNSSTIGGLANVQGASTFTSNNGLVTASARSKAYKNGNQSIPNTTQTAITFDANYFDVGSATIHSTTVNTSRFTVPSSAAGLYSITFSFTMGSATGTVQGIIRKNGSTVIALITQSLVSAFNGQYQVSGLDNASGGDYYELVVWQSSGGAVDVVGNATYAADTNGYIYRLTLQD